MAEQVPHIFAIVSFDASLMAFLYQQQKKKKKKKKRKKERKVLSNSS